MATCFACCALEACQCASCMACSCFSSVVGATMSQASRVGHLFIIIATFVFAIVIGTYYPDNINGYASDYAKIDLTGDCGSGFTDECIYRQLIYRASLSLVLLFSLLALTSFFSDYVNKSFWAIKFAFAFTVFIGFWWGSNGSFSNWAEVCRVVSFFWLIMQGFLLFDFAHDTHDVIIAEADREDTSGGDSTIYYIVYMFFAVAALALTLLGLSYLFMDYSSCQLGMGLIVSTLIIGIVTTVLSMLNVINKGFLTPCIMFAYSVFICWYALLANPNASCNPTANDNGGKVNDAVIIISVITLVVLFYCIGNGTRVLNVFDAQGEGVIQSYSARASNSSSPTAGEATAPAALETNKTPLTEGGKDVESGRAVSTDGEPADGKHNESSGTPSERAFFHVLMVLVSCYGAMILTSWGKTNGEPVAEANNGNKGSESLWLIITSQWVFVLLYLRSLYVTYANREE